jgi:hypothetical protein
LCRWLGRCDAALAGQQLPRGLGWILSAVGSCTLVSAAAGDGGLSCNSGLLQ